MLRIGQMMCVIVALVMMAVAPSAHARPEGFADLVENLSPAVVNISTSQKLNTNFSDNEQLQRYEEKLNSPSVSLGSGFIIDPTGIVVTNNHVVDGADEITVTLNDGREYQAIMKGRDTETDLAVLQMQNARNMPHVRFGDSNKARVGDWVIAVGNPFGLGGTVTVGIVSARNRDIESGLYDDFIQTDAAINRGNSGGPLFNTDGRVIGVNTAIFSQTGGSVGVGFAVPSDLAQTVVEQLIEYGQTQRGWLGVTLEDVDKDRASGLGLPNTDGALVVSVRSGSPALLGGIKAEDFIISFDGKKVEEVRDLTRAVADTKVGRVVSVRVLREGKPITLRVKIDRRESNLANLGDFRSLLSELPDDAASTNGLVLQTATPEVRDAFGLSGNITGVVVTAVDPDSPAGSVLQPGDVILQLGFQDVTDPAALAERMDKLRNLNSGPLQVQIQRGNILMYELLKP
jgi:serine protease Do